MYSCIRVNFDIEVYINIFLNNFPRLVTVLFLLILGLQQTIIIGWLVLHYVRVPVSLLNSQ